MVVGFFSIRSTGLQEGLAVQPGNRVMDERNDLRMYINLSIFAISL